MKLALASLVLLMAAAAFGQYSAYLPAQNQLLISPTYVFQTFDEYWASDKKQDLGTRQHQNSGFVTFEYGLVPTIALDVTLGYTSAKFEDGPEDDGLADTTIGARWKFLENSEAPSSDGTLLTFAHAPTLAVRAGAIIEGTYDENFAFSAGDGASGFETSLLLGMEICTGFGIYGDIGWRTRNHSVPDDLFGSIGAHFKMKGFSLSGGYRHVQGLDGGNIGSPKFVAGVYGFPQVKEINQLVEASLGYTDRGGRYYSLFGAKNVDGKNTGDKWIGGVSLTFPIGGR
jgi:hypothetical protein